MADDPVNLGDLLNKPSSAYPDRPQLPGGKTFFGKLTGSIEAKESTVKGTPYYELGVRLTDPGKDIPPGALDALAKEGFSLADYDMVAQFYLTGKAMPMFRQFCDSLGLDESKTFIEKLALNPENYEPTADTTEILRGKDVIIRTQKADENGRVYNRVDNIAGLPASAKT